MEDTLVLQQILGMVFGVISIMCNSFLLFVIFKCKELHFNAFYLAATLALTDVLDGIGFFAGGAYQLAIILRNETNTYIEPWQCIYSPAYFLFIIGYHGGSMVMMLIACDRFLSIAFVHTYSGLGKRYTLSMITFAALYSLALVAWFTYDLFCMPSQPSIIIFCYDPFSEIVHMYDTNAVIVLASGSVILMVITMIILRIRTGNTGQIDGTLGAAAARNRKAARLLSWISFNAFLMWILPQIFIGIMDTYGNNDPDGWYVQCSPFLWLLQPLHAVTNLLIYFRKGGQIRKAFNAMRAQTTVEPMGSSRQQR